MASRASAVLTLAVVLALAHIVAAAYDSSFAQNMNFAGYCKNTDNCKTYSDGSVSLSAMYNKMGAFQSKSYYKYGIFRIRMKLPSGYSGGLIPCIYLMSGSGNSGYKDIHDEIDFEFLGGSSPSEIIMHTNLITGGQTFLEQFKFPFDPSAAWHTYSLVYSPDYVMWAVDDTPIRITYKESGRPFPSAPVRLQGSIWDASSWSPLKSDFSRGAVQVKFRRFDFKDTCKAASSYDNPRCASRTNAPWRRKPSSTAVAKNSAYRSKYLKASYGWKNV